jgi:hydrophobe/amphiphile efflux-1 (HAE1) family protein
MISRIFIERPLLACVLSAFIVIAGLIALNSLKVSLYPDILPPMVDVSTSYPGASPAVVAETVSAPLEQQINGTEDMIYQRSAATPNGSAQTVVTFAIGTDADQAVINVQNRIQAALPSLPEEVRRQGVTVRKLNWTAVSYIGFYAPDGRYDSSFVSNYVQLNVIDELRRIPGIAAADIYGAREYSIRIWLQPDKLAQLGLSPMDVAQAVREQNSQFATGRVGDEPLDEYTDQAFNIVAQGRLTTPAEFEKIIVRADDSGSLVHLKDIARVELGARDYSISSIQNGKPAVAIGIFPQHGANVIELSNAVRATLARLRADYPAGLKSEILFDTSDFVRVSIHEVLKTLVEAVILVFLVVYIFLQNWRATLIPCLAVPVSLMGALAGMFAMGININLTTLFAMVLSIGIVVDDAIVVLENVERHMRTEGVNAKEATRRAMAEVTGPLIAIVLVLTAVFLPVAFLGGLVGEMYRQFAITISLSVIVSGFVALTLTPALCALFLKPHVKKTSSGGMGERFRNGFERVTLRYSRGSAFFIRHGALSALLFTIMLGATWQLNRILPTSLVPDEDQGYIIGLPFLPPASSSKRTDAVMLEIDKAFQGNPAVFQAFGFGNTDPYTFLPRPGTGFSFITFKPWDERKDPALQSPALVTKMNDLNGVIKDALVFGAPPPPIEGLSATGGFEGFVQARKSTDYKALEAATAKLVAAAAERPEVVGVFTSFSAQVPQSQLDVNREQAKLLGVNIDDVFATLQSTFGSYYVNDFNMVGRVYRVHMQADATYRTRPDDLRNVYVRSKSGKPIPITAIAEVKTVTGPDLVERFNAFPAARLLGAPAPGYSSGQALKVMEELAQEHLPEGFTLAWNAQAFLEQQATSNTAGLFVLGMLMVFLILAAQYERLSLPLAVILSVPFAVFGALLATWARGLYNDLYLQIGLVTLVGLAAKNAILIVEFAAVRVKEGVDIAEAAVEAARLRFRPILMTSLAFIFGVMPLAISGGAGANARHSIATGVIGGMIAATFLATLFTPLFFCWAERLGRYVAAKFNRHPHADSDAAQPNVDPQK